MKFIFLPIILIFAFFYIFSNLTINNEIPMNSGGVEDEFIVEYIQGKNFALKGFAHLYFLQDESTDLTKNSQPVFYTLNPPLPSLLQGLIIKIGLNIIQSRIIYIIISLTGLAFLYLFIADIASIPAAVISSVLLIINFSGFLSLVDHNHYALGFPLLFIYLWAYSIKSPKKYFIIPIIFLISSWASYMLLPFMIILGFLFFIFEKDKKLFFSSAAAAMVGIFIHIIQNILALTPAIAWQDILLTAQNRLYGIPSRHELLKFYQDHNLTLWGTEKLLISSPINEYLHSASIPFRLFKTPLFVAIISAFVFYIKRQGNFYKSRRILIPIFLAFLIWHFSIVQTVGAYPPIFHICLAIFLGVILSDLLSVFIQNFSLNKLSFKKISIKILILSAILLISSKYFTWAGKISNDENLSNLLKISAEYQGKTFFTNLIMPNAISFKTGNWTVGSCLPPGILNLDASYCYSKFTTLTGKQLIPDYILLSSRSFAFDCSEDCVLNLKKKLAVKEGIGEGNAKAKMIF